MACPPSRPSPTHPPRSCALSASPALPTPPPGELDITYLDEELRISRGNRGNLFVLRMDPKDRSIKP